MDVQTKREREKTMVSEMIALYCRKNHGTKKEQLCEDCAALEAYARLRSDKCPFMETKTFCSNCRVHCYRPEMREKIRLVMRSSGDGDSSCDRIQEREKTAGKGRNEIKICRTAFFDTVRQILYHFSQWTFSSSYRSGRGAVRSPSGQPRARIEWGRMCSGRSKSVFCPRTASARGQVPSQTAPRPRA